VSGPITGVLVNAGTASLSGGSVSSDIAGVVVNGGVLTAEGCDLTLSSQGQLSGILADGSLIDTPAAVSPPGQLVLQNSSTGPPELTCPANVTAVATSAAGAMVSYSPPAVSNACGQVMVACAPASGSTFPVGDTTVNCTATDQLGNTGQCSFTVTVAPSADLSITKAAPSTTPAGSALSYTLTVANAGPFTAHGVIVTDPLPAGTVFQGAARSANVGSLTTPPKGAGGTVSWSVGDLATGQSVKLTLLVKVTAPSGSSLTNIAQVTSSTADSNPGNNSSAATTHVK
jgi:uncharacterized repeat protein (TIGR01451 family)